MIDLVNWRFDPFGEVINDAALTDELHTVQYDVSANRYGIRLNEGIRLIGSLPFNNNSDFQIVEDETGGAVFTEVARGTNPSTGQFRVDYDAATYYSTSFIEFHSSANNTVVRCKYRGTGTVAKAEYRSEQDVIVPNLIVENNLTVDGQVEGNLDVNGDVTADDIIADNMIVGVVSANEFQIGSEYIDEISQDETLASPSGHAVLTTEALAALLPFRNYEKLTASGNWSVPAGVSKVFAKIVGGGGGGGGGTGAANGGSGLVGGDSIFYAFTAEGGLPGGGNSAGNRGGNGSGRNSMSGQPGFAAGGGYGGGYGGGTADTGGGGSKNGEVNTGGGGGGGAGSTGYGGGGASGGVQHYLIDITGETSIAYTIGAGGTAGTAGGAGGTAGGDGGSGYIELWY